MGTLKLPLKKQFGDWTAIGFVVSLVISFFAANTASAQANGLKMYQIHQNYVSVRALGMGGAYTAVADDYNTLFLNPGGLQRIASPNIDLGVGAGLDSKFLKLRQDINETSSSNSVNDMVNLLQSNYGNHYGARFPTLSAIWVRPGWGIAFIPVDLSIDMEIHQLGMAAVNLQAYQDTTIAFGKAFKVNWLGDKNDLSVGATAKTVYRAYFGKALLASDLATDSNILQTSDADEGMTADLDLGALWTPKLSEGSWWKIARPSLGMTVHNVVNYGFKTNMHFLAKDTGTPPPLGRRLDLGSMFELPDWWIFKTRAMADIHDIGDENWTLKKGSHLGAEFLWKVKSWWQGGWRVGVGQGYFSAGFSGTFAMFTLDLATYGEEVGTSDAPKANRIYMAKASLDW